MVQERKQNIVLTSPVRDTMLVKTNRRQTACRRYATLINVKI